MKKIELNKVKIANLNQVDMNDVKGGAWTTAWCWVSVGYVIGKVLDTMSTNTIDACTDLPASANCGNYSKEPTCTVSVCDNI